MWRYTDYFLNVQSLEVIFDFFYNFFNNVNIICVGPLTKIYFSSQISIFKYWLPHQIFCFLLFLIHLGDQHVNHWSLPITFINAFDITMDIMLIFSSFDNTGGINWIGINWLESQINQISVLLSSFTTKAWSFFIATYFAMKLSTGWLYLPILFPYFDFSLFCIAFDFQTLTMYLTLWVIFQYLTALCHFDSGW